MIPLDHGDRSKHIAAEAIPMTKDISKEPENMTPSENPRQKRFVLNNGDGEIPALGFGTLVSDSNETRNATRAAVEVGFRHLDVPSGTATKKRLAQRSKSCSPTERSGVRTCL